MTVRAETDRMAAIRAPVREAEARTAARPEAVRAAEASFSRCSSPCPSKWTRERTSTKA